jgi:hypothetical protein
MVRSFERTINERDCLETWLCDLIASSALVGWIQVHDICCVFFFFSLFFFLFFFLLFFPFLSSLFLLNRIVVTRQRVTCGIWVWEPNQWRFPFLCLPRLVKESVCTRRGINISAMLITFTKRPVAFVVAWSRRERSWFLVTFIYTRAGSFSRLAIESRFPTNTIRGTVITTCPCARAIYSTGVTCCNAQGERPRRCSARVTEALLNWIRFAEPFLGFINLPLRTCLSLGSFSSNRSSISSSAVSWMPTRALCDSSRACNCVKTYARCKKKNGVSCNANAFPILFLWK